MAKFCTKCGNPIDQCTCVKQQSQDVCEKCGFPKNYCICDRSARAVPQDDYQQPQVNYRPVKPAPPAQGQPAGATRGGGFCTRCGKPKDQCTCAAPAGPSGNGSFCTKCGNPREYCTCGSVDVSFGKRVKDYFGFGLSDKTFKDNSLEEGKNIVPVLINPAQEEQFIKQYDVGRMRRRLTFSLGYSRIVVTNKRIIERSVNKSVFGKDVSHDEFAIDEIMGISYQRGKTFSLADFLLFLVIGALAMAPFFGIATLIKSSILAIIFSIIAFIGAIAYKVVFSKTNKTTNFITYLIFFVGAGLGLAATDAASDSSSEMTGIVCSALCGIGMLIFLIKCAYLPSITLNIVTRTLPGTGVTVGFGGAHVIRNAMNKMIILPGDNTEQAVRELGAIVNDVQKYGDYAVEKWAKK